MTTKPIPSYAHPIIEPADVAPSVESVVVTFSRGVHPAILESSLRTTPYAQFSIFTCDPVAEFVFRPTDEGCPFRRFAEHVAGYPRIVPGQSPVPFVGGWIGYFGYESGLTIEGITPSVTPDDRPPYCRLHLYDSAAVYDHEARMWYVLAVDWPVGTVSERPPASQRLAAMRERLAAAVESVPGDPPVPPQANRAAPNMTRSAYLDKVRQAKQHIAAGDIYQLNLTQRFTVRTGTSPLELYRRLRRTSPSSHAVFLPWGNVAIISSSPELFLELRGRHVVTRPIKGTRPRIGDPVADAVFRRELTESEKELAELNMIIDLLRNDLGRVCSFGTVRVTAAGDLEEHPTVYHRVATVEGRLAAEHDWLDLLRATFPGGSITGAPKIRAMQIIEELEPTPRGVYCGSIGYLSLDGAMSLNIAIRTMVQVENLVHVHAGGAIVADSVPEDEYDEVMAKATGMFRALGCPLPAAASVSEEATVS